jgi:Ca2+-binding EF-hand superfamily protein
MRPALLLLAVAVTAGVSRAADPPAKPTAVPLECALLDGDSPVRLALRAEVNGMPVSAVWADAFAELFAYHDRNGDGSLDAKEAATLPTARAVRQAVGSGFTPPAGGAPELSELDADKDGKVSPSELVAYYRSAGLGNVIVGVGRLPATAELTQALVKRLDTDGDGLLSEKEWKAAADALKKLDMNDDELVGAGELSAKVVYPGAAGTHLLSLPSAGATTPDVIAKCPLVLLPTDPKNADWAAGVARRNPKLKAADWTAWREKAPAEEWAVKLSDKSPAADRFSLQGNAVRVEGWVTGGKLAEATETARKQMIALLNAPTEGTGPRPSAGLKWLLPTADRDGDGKLDRKELDAWLDLQAQLCRGLVFVTLLDDGGLFELIDTNHDGALSVRELRTAWDTLTAAGCTRDGKCDPKKLPRLLLAVASVGYPQSIAVDNRRGPDWFRAMDRNGDGDVSKREFTGTREVFAELDTDKDGLLSPDEAEKAKK